MRDPGQLHSVFRRAAISLLAMAALSCSPGDSTDSSESSNPADAFGRVDETDAQPTIERSDARPNVLLVVLDTTRASAVSAYGNEKPTTPHFDRLAAEGVLFERAMATDFWTLPTHASLLTGLYPSDHGATSETNALPDRAKTLAERLREAGFATGAFVTNSWVSAERGFDRGFDIFAEAWHNGGSAGTHILDRRTFRKANAWIVRQHREGRPFFAMLNLNGAHMPYTPPPDVLLGSSPRSDSSDRSERLRKIAGMWKFLGGALELDELDFRIMRENYEAEVHMVDQLVGKLIDRLIELGIYDETLIIVTSDHGENVGEHGRIDHLFSMYETTIHIPLVIRYPARFDAGRIDGELASQVDVMPTVLDVVGLAAEDPDVRARSLANPARQIHDFVIAENDRPINGIELMEQNYPDFDVTTIDHRIRMLRTKRHKLIWRSNDEIELFDLEADPTEEHDLAATSPQIRDAMLERLEQWMKGRRSEGGDSFQTTDPESLEELKALGYIE